MHDRYVFAQDRVRFVGEQVAAVIARDKETAMRAAKLVHVEYKMLPAILDVATALKQEPLLIHPDWENIRMYRGFFQNQEPTSHILEK